MVALSIMHQLEIAERSHVIVVDAFAGARGVAERLGSLPEPFSGVSAVFVESPSKGYHLLRNSRFSAIFIDADVGVRKSVDLLRIRYSNPGLKINVYEEGLGTYRSDLYGGLKGSVLNYFGVGTRFGGFRFTSSLYLYDPKHYKVLFPGSEPKLERINRALPDFILDHFDTLSDLFDYKPNILPRSKNCNIYLSNWTIDKFFIEKFLSYGIDSYIKPHPHILDFKESEYDLVIDAAAPAEIAIINFLKKYDFVDVYHHGSSIERYIKDSRVRYIRI